jgi:hypothetical protein
MNNHLSTLFILSIFVPAAGCGSSGISGTAETTATVASGGGGAGQPHHSRGLCTPSGTSPAPANGLVADFSPAGRGANGQGIETSGRVVTYASPKLVGPGSMTYSTTGGNLNIKISAPAISRPQLLGTMIQFDSCVDASAFTGVQFTISGSFSGCSLTYATGDVGHEDMAKSSTFASGEAGSYVPQDKISASDLSSTPRTIKQPFVVTDIQGNPPTPIDPTQLIFNLWQFIVPVAADDGSATPACIASVTVDDVKFYH